MGRGHLSGGAAHGECAVRIPAPWVVLRLHLLETFSRRKAAVKQRELRTFPKIERASLLSTEDAGVPVFLKWVSADSKCVAPRALYFKLATGMKRGLKSGAGALFSANTHTPDFGNRKEARRVRHSNLQINWCPAATPGGKKRGNSWRIFLDKCGLVW